MISSTNFSYVQHFWQVLNLTGYKIISKIHIKSYSGKVRKWVYEIKLFEEFWWVVIKIKEFLSHIDWYSVTIKLVNTIQNYKIPNPKNAH